MAHKYRGRLFSGIRYYVFGFWAPIICPSHPKTSEGSTEQPLKGPTAFWSGTPIKQESDTSEQYQDDILLTSAWTRNLLGVSYCRAGYSTDHTEVAPTEGRLYGSLTGADGHVTLELQAA